MQHDAHEARLRAAVRARGLGLYFSVKERAANRPHIEIFRGYAGSKELLQTFETCGDALAWLTAGEGTQP